MLRIPSLAVAVAAAAAVPAVALAQAPDTVAPSAVLKVSTTTQSLDSLIGNGLVFKADPSEDLTYTAKATIRSKGKTVTVAKSIRAGDLYDSGGGFVEQTIPHGSATAVKALIRIKKGTKVAVTLTLALKDTAGNKATAKVVVKLKKRY